MMPFRFLLYLGFSLFLSQALKAQTPNVPTVPDQPVQFQTVPDAMRVFVLPDLGLTGLKSSGKSILLNGGFEETESGFPTGWAITLLPQTADFVTFDIDRSVFHKGKRSVSLQLNANHPDNQPIFYNWLQIITDFEPRATYTLRGYIKTENVKVTPVVVIQCWDQNFSQMIGFSTTESLFSITGTKDWTKVQTGIIVPSGTAYIVIRAVLGAPANNGGKVWFDDLKLTKAKR